MDGKLALLATAIQLKLALALYPSNLQLDDADLSTPLLQVVRNVPGRMPPAKQLGHSLGTSLLVQDCFMSVLVTKINMKVPVRILS